MRRIALYIILFWSLSVSAQHSVSAVQYSNYDAFKEGDSLLINPVLPALGKAEQVGKSYPWLNKKEHNSANSFSIFPLLNFLGSYSDFGNDYSGTTLGAGLGFTTQLSPQFYARVLLEMNTHYYDGFYSSTTSLFRPNFYVHKVSSSQTIGILPSVRLSYTPYDFINLQAGIDHNFIGHGKRSMLLGDYHAPYPFVQLRTKIWKLEVSNLYQFFEEEKQGKTIRKFGSTHFFNFKSSKRFQIGLFETAIFAPKDTLLNRGYEAAYLNPFLFYRPTEYGVGSQDRIVLGLNTSYQFNSFLLYGQFSLDEFLLKELVKRTRWWANKYGGQIGVKWRKEVNVTRLFALAELNFARPFTYSHLDVNTAYGNQGNPLAHPLGANFVEVFTEFEIDFNKKWKVSSQFFFVQQGGNDDDGLVNYGSNIYYPYNIYPFEYGYRIGGNGKLNRYHFSVETSYRFWKLFKTDAFLRVGTEFNNSENPSYKGYFFLMGGIKTALWKDHSYGF